MENGVSLTQKEAYQAYLDQLPVLNKAKLMAIMGSLLSHLYGETPAALPPLHEISVAKADPGPCPVFAEDALQAQADALQTRYNKERAFLDAVARGDESAVDAVGWVTLNRLPNRLRNQKNMMIVLNTLLRKAVERAHVHPYYIDAISGKWAVLIENAQSLTRLDDYYYAIVRDYCALVRKHALKNYTPNIRAAIKCIHSTWTIPTSPWRSWRRRWASTPLISPTSSTGRWAPASPATSPASGFSGRRSCW